MTKRQAVSELRRNLNTGGHAVLLRTGRSWRTELHAGHAGNCCCNGHEDFEWREERIYTDLDELRTI